MARLRYFTPYEWFLLLSIVSLNIITSLITKDFNFLSSLAALSGVLCVVLVAKGHIANYLFGLIQVSLYTYISWGAGYWGEVALNGLYYVPMQFIGFFLWRKRMRKDSKTHVKARHLTLWQRIGVGALSLLSVIVCGFILKRFEDPMPFTDAVTTVFSVIAMILMVGTYSEQWYLWIIVNLCTIVMWVSAAVKGDANAPVISAMWSVYLLNSIHGLFIWNRQAKIDLQQTGNV